MRRLFRRYIGGRGFCLLGILGAVTWLAIGPAMAETGCGSPCFKDIDDILAGDDQLLAVDDILSHLTLKPDSSKLQVDNYINHTISGKITAAVKKSTTCEAFNNKINTSVTSAGIGRLYATRNDVLVEIVYFANQGVCDDLRLQVVDFVNGVNNTTTVVQLHEPDIVPPVLMKLADFDLDGYDDVFLIAYDGINNKTELQIYTAACTGDARDSCSSTQGPGDGLVLAPGSQLVHSPPLAQVAPQAGDFNGDGIVDLVWATGKTSGRTTATELQFASVCPAPGVVLFGTTCTSAMQIIPINTEPLPQTDAAVDMAVGNFDGKISSETGRAADKLLLVASTASDATAKLYYYDGFDEFLAPSEASPKNILTETGLKPGTDGKALDLQAYIVTGRLDWSGQQDQAVWGMTKKSSDNDRRGEAHIVYLDMSDHSDPMWTQYIIQLPKKDQVGQNYLKSRIIGVAVGRFDPPMIDSNGDGILDETNFDQQIAVLMDNEPKGTTGAQVTGLLVYDFHLGDPNDPDDLNSHELTGWLGISGTQYYQNDYFQFNTLLTGDLQGRSLTLGAPEVLTLHQIQPSLILGAPPTHVDYVEGNRWPVVNMSVFPDSFFAQFDFQDSDKKSSTSDSKTSYTISTTVSDQEEVSYKAGGDDASESLKTSVNNTHMKSVDNYDSLLETTKFELGASTGFQDMISYTDQHVTIYSYPVLGQFTCPGDSVTKDNIPNGFCCPQADVSGSNCLTTDPNLLSRGDQFFVQYSGPDTEELVGPTEGSILEWYQPLQQPGNLLSYPPNLALIQKYGPHDQEGVFQLQSVSQSEVWSPAQDGNRSESISWEKDSTTSTKTSTANSISSDVSLSLSEKVSFGGASEQDSLSFNRSESTSLATVNTSTQTTDASTGIKLGLVVGKNNNNNPIGSKGEYQATSYIFSLKEPAGQVQKLPLSTQEGLALHGYLQLSHTTNILDSNVGFWEHQYGSGLFDLAVSHTGRWLVDSATSDGVQFSCPMGFTNSKVLDDGGNPVRDGSCMESTLPSEQPSSANLGDNNSFFYQMKGFFIRPEGETAGPTISMATHGDKLNLQARISNYSLTKIPGVGSTNPHTIKVRFYAQPTDWTGNKFNDWSSNEPEDQAISIGEVDVTTGIDAYCGFDSAIAMDYCNQGDKTPDNWILVDLEWDTSKATGEGDTGRLIDSTKDTYWKFWVAAWVENGGSLVPEILQHGLTKAPTGDERSPADIVIFDYNPDPNNPLPPNIYSNNFGYYNQVFALAKSAETAESEGTADARHGKLSITGHDVPIEALIKNEHTSIRVGHEVADRDLQFLRVSITEEEPGKEPRPIDVNMLPLIRKGTAFETLYRYRPITCGPRTLVFEATARDAEERARLSVLVEVTADPARETEALMHMLQNDLPHGIQKSLKAKLRSAWRSFEREQNTAGFNKLNAFSKQVMAQTGKKIPIEDAERLLSAVNDIEECLMWN